MLMHKHIIERGIIMNIEEIIMRYGDSLKGRYKSQNTQRNYIATTKRFIEQGGIKSLTEITPDSISAFCIKLNDNGVGGTSNNAYLAALRSFFQYAFRNKYIMEDYSNWEECKNISKSIAIRYRGKRQFNDPEEPDGKSISKTDRKKIISSALQNTRSCGSKLKSTEGERNALMIEVGWVCGFRISDLLTLKVENFDFELEKVDKIMKKTNTRVKFFIGSSKLVEKLQQYIGYNNLSSSNYLFPTNRSDCMAPSSFWQIFNNILQIAGLPAGKENDGYAPHDLRRTCATELYNRGMPLKEISLRLGHSSVVMTENYLRLDDTIENVERTRKMVQSVFG